MADTRLTPNDIAATRASWPRRRRRKNDAIYVLARGALACVSIIPRSWLSPLGRLVGFFVYFFAASARRTAIGNLERVLELPSREARVKARACFVELGGLLGDTVTLFRTSERAARSLAMPDAAAAVFAEARVHGRGVVLVTAHFGAWERMAALLVESGLPLTTPVKPSYDPRLERDVLSKLRTSRGVRAVDRDGAATPIALLRALKRNELAGFLVDLQTRATSTTVLFLGHPAKAVTAPARLALRTGAPIVLAIAGREAVEARLLRGAAPPMREISEEQVISLTRTIAQQVGEAIRQDPTRWIWMHDRWTC